MLISNTAIILLINPNLLKINDTNERINLTKSERICLNCLSGTHKTHDCKSKYTCKVCKKHHHSLLHLDKSIKTNLAQFETINVQANIAAHHAGSVPLATAIVGVRSKHGETIMLRALLDQGSQKAFISESAAQTLKLNRKSISAEITGIGAKTQAAKHAVELTLFPRFESDFSLITTEAIILPKLSDILLFGHNMDSFDFTDNLTLADPSFLNHSEVDLIPGGSVGPMLLRY